MNFLAYEDGITMGQAVNVSITGMVVVLIVLTVLALLVRLLSKVVRSSEKALKKGSNEKVEDAAVVAPAAVAAPIAVASSASQALTGSVDLKDTDEKTAAVIMAIVSKESGIPLNRLKFNSIKLIKE